MTSIADTSRVLLYNDGHPWRISCMCRTVQVTGLVPRQKITGSKWLQEEIKTDGQGPGPPLHDLLPAVRTASTSLLPRTIPFYPARLSDSCSF